MEDYFEDFDDFGENGFTDDDSFEDSFDEDLEPDESLADKSECDDEPDQTELQDDDLTVDPFFIGGAMGFAYEEGLREGKRRKRKRFKDDSD